MARVDVCVDEVVDYTDDQTLPPRLRRKWCHLRMLPETDPFDDDARRALVEFGRRIGLRDEWLQKPNSGMVHYDLTERMRAVAVRAGALEIPRREWARRAMDAADRRRATDIRGRPHDSRRLT